ncbi:MAG: P-loop NTPase fold protein [Kofleriaceae bacterium]
MGEVIDPRVELLADVPILGAAEDLFERRPIATRLVELAVAEPMTLPRVVALDGPCGAGKSSVLRMVAEIVAERAGLAIVSIDAEEYGSAQALTSEIGSAVSKLFSELGVAKETDKIRDTLVNYGGIVSGVIGLAGVKVNLTSALERSAASLRTEIANNLQLAKKRLVLSVDHVDYMPSGELRAVFAALQMYAAIPYITIVIAIDRHALDRAAVAPAVSTGAGVASPLDPRAFDRLVHTHLVLPPADRIMLARVMVGGLDRLGARLGRDLSSAIALFDPEGGQGLALVHTPRDAKRAINALSAALPLVTASADLEGAAFAIVQRVLGSRAAG